MLLELEPPFSDKWRLAYLIVGEDMRRRVFLYNTHQERAGLSYARYLMCVKLGRMLTPDEHVDHIDEDKTNDDIDNLQILTQEQNQLKSMEWRRANGRVIAPVLLICPICDNEFIKTGKKAKDLLTHGKTVTCSKSCSAKVQYRQGKAILGKPKKQRSPAQHALIVELRAEGKSDYTIAEITGIHRASVQRYRKEKGIA